MANYYYSSIRCVSNPELLLLMDPQIFIRKTPSEFIQKNFDELIYETRRYTMHRDIITFSERFPDDEFIARYVDSELQEPMSQEIFWYRNGDSQFVGFEPVYKYSNHDHIYDEMGRETWLKLWNQAREYLFRLDQTKECKDKADRSLIRLDQETRSMIRGDNYYIDSLEDHDHYCVSSSVTVHAEINNFKLSMDKITNAELIFRGYKRGSENEDWVEILPESHGQEP